MGRVLVCVLLGCQMLYSTLRTQESTDFVNVLLLVYYIRIRKDESHEKCHHLENYYVQKSSHG